VAKNHTSYEQMKRYHSHGSVFY